MWKTLFHTVSTVSGRPAASTIGERRGQGHGRAFVRHGVFGIAAAGNQRADPVAGLPARDAFADGFDLAGDFKAQRVGRARRRRIAAGALDKVGTVYPRRVNPDQNLSRSGRGLPDFVQGRACSPTTDFTAVIISLDISGIPRFNHECKAAA